MNRFFGVVFFLCAGLSASIRDAHEAFADKDYTRARRELEVLQVNKPYDYTINYDLGVTQYRQKKYDESLISFDRARQSAKTDEQKLHAQFNAGNSLYRHTLSVLGDKWQEKTLKDEIIDKALELAEQSKTRYEEILENYADHQRSQANKKIVEQLIEELKRKKEQQQQQNNQDDSNNDQQQNKDDSQEGQQQNKDNQNKKSDENKDKQQDKQDQSQQDQKQQQNDQDNQQDDRDKQGKDQQDNQRDQQKHDTQRDHQRDDHQDHEQNKQQNDTEQQNQQEQQQRGDQDQQNDTQDGEKDDSDQARDDRQQEGDQSRGQSDHKQGDHEQSGEAGQPGEQQQGERVELRGMKAVLDQLQAHEGEEQRALMKKELGRAARRRSPDQKTW